MNPRAEAALTSELLKDERLVWAGQPDPNRHITEVDRFLIPCSILWGGFAFFWEATALREYVEGDEGTRLFFVLWGIPFVMVGLYFMFGRFVYKARKKKRTYYGVTNRRVLSVVTGSGGNKVDAAFIDAIPSINKRIRNDGSGWVIFGSPLRWDLYANSGMDLMPSWGGGRLPVAFYDIPDVGAVAQKVNDLRDN